MWGRVRGLRNCYSTEFSELYSNSRQLRDYYYGDNEESYSGSYVYDIRGSISLLDVLNASRRLHSLTNSSRPLAPRDLNFANDILETIIR